MIKAEIKQKSILSAIGIAASILLYLSSGLFFSAGLKVPGLDTTTDSYFRDAITKAGVAYATCRVVNASVSVIKESNLQLEPAGIGLSLAVGQIVDPIDDMTERLSDVLVTAITSLGVQKLAYEISVSLAPPIFSAFLLVLSLLVWVRGDRIARLKKVVMQILLIIVIARFCLPMSSMANVFLHEHFFADKIADANRELSLISAELDNLQDLSLPEIDGIFGTIEKSASFLKRKSMEFNTAVLTFINNMGEIIENLLQLTFIYVAVFLIQVIILPLLTFWFFIKVNNSIFHTNRQAGSAPLQVTKSLEA